ncbi:MAG: TolC family protein [Bdellovibrionales bacterium]
MGLLLGLCAEAWAATDGLVGMRSLLSWAKESQVDWREATYAREKAGMSVTSARSVFLPDLGLRSTYTYDWQLDDAKSDSVSSEAMIVSTWSLYDNGTSFRTFRIRNLELEKAKLQETTAHNSVSYEVFDRYLRHLLARRQKEITTGKLNLLVGQYRLTQQQYRQGLKTRRDYQRLESETERARLNLLRQENSEKDSFDELKRYLGVSGAALTSMEKLKIVPVASFLPAMQRMRDFNKIKKDQVLTVRTAELDKDVRRLQSLQADTPLWPMVDLNGQVGYGSQSFAGFGESWRDQDRFYGQGLVQFSWNLWDWGGRRSTARAAQLDERLSHLRFDQSRLNADAEFERLLRDYLRLEKSLAVVRKVHSIELSTFRDIEVEYREGRASYLDLITSLDRRSQAELDVEQETVAMLLNMSQLLRMTGDLYEACLQLD